VDDTVTWRRRLLHRIMGCYPADRSKPEPPEFIARHEIRFCRYPECLAQFHWDRWWVEDLVAIDNASMVDIGDWGEGWVKL
jgi:hypothetical protein